MVITISLFDLGIYIMKTGIKLIINTLVLLYLVNIPLAHAQNFERTPFTEVSGWTITTYRAKDTGEFLRCSAEMHYANKTALTIARTASSYTLAYTSTEWPFEDNSMPMVSAHVDAYDILSVQGRVRLLNSGPIVFMSVEPGSAILAGIAKGRVLHVHADKTSIDFDLTGSSKATSAVEECWQAGTS
jgi:hypothetical protein